MPSKPPQTTLLDDFGAIYHMITAAQAQVWQQANRALIELYYQVGRYISEKTERQSWGQGVVEELARYIQAQGAPVRGFSARNLWRMKQFYETYQDQEKLSTLLTEISWSNHLHILSKTKSLEEKEFYLQLVAKKHYPARDLARLIDSAAFERTRLADQKLSTALAEFPASIQGVFKDSYVFEFLGLPDSHQESDLRHALVRHLKQFLLELGVDFSFIGEEYMVQVGNKDFRIDLLMHHRGLNCLAAIELKVGEFQPEHLGKLQFYLEALDRDIKKPHENPSIGILICKTKDDEVVKYALSRSVSPTLIAEYETKLINKQLLQKKLHELAQSLENLEDEHE